MTARRVVLGLMVLAALLIIAGRFGASLYTDYLWYAAMGATRIWRAKLMATTAVTIGSFAAAALFAFVNLYAVRQSVVSLVLPRRIGNIEIGEEVPSRYLFGSVLILSVLIGAVLTLPTDLWHTALLAKMGRPFAERDPYFSADLGFFVYWLPFESSIHFWSIMVLVTVTVSVILLYALTPSLRWDRGTLYISAYVRRHFTMLGAVLLLILAWSYRLSMYQLLSFGGSTGGAFGLVDDKVLVPAALLLAVMTLCAAIVVGWAGWTGQMRLAFAAVTAVLFLSLASRTVAPLVYRRSIDPAEGRRTEFAYVATRLAYTRVAYGVDHMRPEPVGAGFTSLADVAARVAIWDGALLERAETRTRRTQVVGNSPGWHATTNGVVATLVERGSEGADGRDSWSISRFDGATADQRGLPQRPADSMLLTDVAALEEPAVYDSAPGYSVLSDSLGQLLGVEMVSTRSRFLHAWSLQNFRLLFGAVPSNRPVMVQRRDVRDRLEALVPFFVQGSEVRPAVAQDTLYWVVELYSTSSTYPLSQRFTVLGSERSYFVHAATAVIYPHSGRVRFLLAPNADPVALSWARYFPGLLEAPASFPAWLLAALPPIVDGARAQAAAFAVAGFRGDSLETRHFPTIDADNAPVHDPIVASFTPATGASALWPLLDSTDRVRGTVSAAGGATRVTSWIPMVGTTKRWGIIMERMRVPDSVTRESSTMRGALRVVPLGGQPLYIQPTFLVRLGASPLLEVVTVLQNDSVRTGRSLADALGQSTARARADSAGNSFRRMPADSLYAAMRQALARGDWAAFGRAFDELGIALKAGLR